MTAKTNSLCVALIAGLLLSTATQAAEPLRGAYRAELNRCLAALRVKLEDADTTKIRYTIQDVEKRGAWYEFEISSEVYHEAGQGPVLETESRCRARRWSDLTEITG